MEVREFHGLYSPWGRRSQTRLSDLHFREYKNPGSIWASQGGSVVKNLPASAGGTGNMDAVPDWEDSLEEKMATHSSILVWRILWIEEPGGYGPWGHKELDMTETT